MQCSPRRGALRQEAAKKVAPGGRRSRFQKATGPPAPPDRRSESCPGGSGHGRRSRGLESEQGGASDADHLSGAHRTGRRVAGGTCHSSPDATADEIEAIVAAEGVAVMTGEQPVPRHREISDRLAKHILAQLGCR